MKVAETRASTPGLKSSRARRSGGAGFSVAVDTPENTSGTASAAPAAQAGHLLLAQEVGDDGAERRRARTWGDDLLDRLDEVRADMLSGRIPVARLNGLLSALRAQRPAVVDPRLIEVIDEIELRAAVEIAKMERYS